MTYDFCRIVIEKKVLTRADLLEKLDVFYMRDRISREQYEELVAMVEEAELIIASNNV